MTDKKACGSCGSKSGCGCGSPNPYEQSVEVVWHDPTKYDVSEHGPSFFPKLAGTQKNEVRSFLRKQAAFYDVPQPAQPTLAPLALILQFARALAHVHQSHHWQTSGPGFYADHQLFERLYNESLEFIDQIAERSVGLDGPESVDPFLHASAIAMIVAGICGNLKGDSMASSIESTSPDLLGARSLRGEVSFLRVVSFELQKLRNTGKMTHGTSNLLEGVCDKHESFVYLLKQRFGQTAYSYNRS